MLRAKTTRERFAWFEILVRHLRHVGHLEATRAVLDAYLAAVWDERADLLPGLREALITATRAGLPPAAAEEARAAYECLLPLFLWGIQGQRLTFGPPPSTPPASPGGRGSGRTDSAVGPASVVLHRPENWEQEWARQAGHVARLDARRCSVGVCRGSGQ